MSERLGCRIFGHIFLAVRIETINDKLYCVTYPSEYCKKCGKLRKIKKRSKKK